MKRILTLIIISVALLLYMGGSSFSEDASGTKAPAVQGEGKSAGTTAGDKNTSNGTKKDEIKKLEEKVEATKEIIKNKENTVDVARIEVEKALAEKEDIEKTAKLKGEAAALTKKEAELTKKEAKDTENKELLKKARELEKEAKRLEKEAELYYKKLGVVESKAQIALEGVATKETNVQSLKKALESLEREKSERRSLSEKLLETLKIIAIGIFFILFLNVAIKSFEKLSFRSHVAGEREIVLRIKTFGKILYWLLAVFALLMVVYAILEVFGISVAPLLAGAGVIGLAFGFGGQYLIRDVINGFFILVEGQYRIDDVIKVGEYSGLVEDVNLRTTTLRDLEGRAIIIPNGEIKTVVNFTKEYAQALFDIGIAYKEDVDRVIGVIKDIGKGMRQDPYFGRLILDDLEMFGVDNFTDSAVIIKFRIKTLPIRQWEVSREFKRRLKNRFDELGIEIPFPHRKIYWQEDGGRPRKGQQKP
ncbi:MAG: mechanosensitive ion channel [Candidatus Omnitrophica bacterium]|nr:mechanosensitive ion channel [Candidatus Omnitrophota bacterium]